MESQQATQVVLASRPATARASLENFRFETTALPVPGAKQVLLRVETLSLDPYMRGRMNDVRSYAKPAEIGEPMQFNEAIRHLVQEDRDVVIRIGSRVAARAGAEEHHARQALAINPSHGGEKAIKNLVIR